MIERTVILIFELTGHDQYQVNKRPDAKASESEQLKDAAHNAPRVEAMHTEGA
jgi:hypothetical protein